jgi:superfamily I DNA/RNA helicase
MGKSKSSGGSLGGQIATFPVTIDIPASDCQKHSAAAEAVRREYRDSVKWKKLRCREVVVVDEREGIYALVVDQQIEFDWTWEGAIAFKPIRDSVLTEPDSSVIDAGGSDELNEAALWAGDVLEVDEATSRLFVSVANPEKTPTTGTFYVRPFEFLAYLNAVFNSATFLPAREQLSGRLEAAEGGVHPRIEAGRQSCLPGLSDWWGRAWSLLWGPPGTGKTYTTGQQVAAALTDPSERILVVSTTNRATDAAAVEIGRAVREVFPHELHQGHVLRVGKGASIRLFETESLEDMLKGTETDYLRQIDRLLDQLRKSKVTEEKALLRKRIQDIRHLMKGASEQTFLDVRNRVVVSTSFRATGFLDVKRVREMVLRGFAPFTTIFIDEAGLISRAAAAALSLLAARRVVLVGDSRQLAPISRISRILAADQKHWLASSGLSHLDSLESREPAVHVLREQRRMHPQVCDAVSRFHYGGALKTAADVEGRPFALPKLLVGHPRAIWYVLDEDGQDLPHIRAERGPGNRSWVRTGTTDVLRKLFKDVGFRESSGMFVSPFKAQAKDMAGFFATQGYSSWTSSTVHSQQGAERSIVVFDTVNAGSYGWPYDEWKRLVNVAISRAREAVIVLASRAEMSEPYLSPLLDSLAPRICRFRAGRYELVEVPGKVIPRRPSATGHRTGGLGEQIALRKVLRPVLSNEQQRLCGYEMDGGPRLVRGVAGSGKTAVLAHWLAKTLKQVASKPNAVAWVVYANNSLRSLIEGAVVQAWQEGNGNGEFPADRVELHHIKDLLRDLLKETGCPTRPTNLDFDYDSAAAEYLLRKGEAVVQPRCNALFVDEAQDMGSNTLRLLSLLVETQGDGARNHRAVNIFYDNAQDIYGRGTPTWSQIGLDMQGRSTVMKESFRSTKPISEFAINVLYTLKPPVGDPDHEELVKRGLIEQAERAGRPWWNVRFNQIDGPRPIVNACPRPALQYQAVGDYIYNLIAVEGVVPEDICLLYIGQAVKKAILGEIAERLKPLNVDVEVRVGQSMRRSEGTVLATTPHSFKGYDAEVIVIPAADRFYAPGRGALANELYVAMTRARSLLALFTASGCDEIIEALKRCSDQLLYTPVVDPALSARDEFRGLLEVLGDQQGQWLYGLLSSHHIVQEPIVAPDGEVVAEPVFWLTAKDHRKHACFGKIKPSQTTLTRLADLGVAVLPVGAAVP